MNVTTYIVQTVKGGIQLGNDGRYDENPARSRDVLEESVYLNLLRVHHVLRRDMRAFFEQFDLTHRQYNVLRILYVGGNEGLPCQTIRERLVTNVSDISRLIDRLAEKGLVGRERSEEDRRVVLIHLTEGGKQRCEAVDQDLIAFHKRQFDHLDQEQIEQLDDLLMELLDRPHSTREGGD